MFKEHMAHVASIAAALVHVTACQPSQLSSEDHIDVTRAAIIDMHGADIDIAEQLAAIAGLEVTEVPEQAPPGYRFFELEYQQPVNHHDPDGAVFTQRMALLHTSHDAPMIFNPQGYGLYAPYIHEPTALVAGNQLSVEHRYYGASIPQPTDWQHLTIVQAAADHHRIVEHFKPLYGGAWISTGGSKGGMTALFHRRLYPDDVDATIPYVAPLDRGIEDSRYLAFLQHVGPADCRLHLRALQREALTRRHRLAPAIEELAARYGAGFNRIRGGAEAALDIGVAELGFQFWQYGQVSDCDALPGLDASDNELIWLLLPTIAYATDSAVDYYLSYYYQSLTEMGTARLATEHLGDLLLHDPNDYTLYTGDIEIPGFDRAAMDDMASWARTESESVLYIYGEIDPWTAGAWPTPGNAGSHDVHAFIAPGGNHGAEIADLGAADRAAALAVLERWTGVSPDLTAAAASASSRRQARTNARTDARSAAGFDALGRLAP